MYTCPLGAVSVSGRPVRGKSVLTKAIVRLRGLRENAPKRISDGLYSNSGCERRTDERKQRRKKEGRDIAARERLNPGTFITGADEDLGNVTT